MRKPTFLTVAVLGVVATPAVASEEAFFSLDNTHSVVLLGFLIFVGLLLYLKVPGMGAGFLDKRADDIRKELGTARSLREEAQTLLASYERKQKEVAEQSAGIVAHAKAEALAAGEAAKAELKASIARRLQAAEDQIASAEASAVKAVRDRAISVAVAAASDVIAKSMSAKDGAALIDNAIADVGKKLH